METEWINALDISELEAVAPPLVIASFTTEEAASFLYKGGRFPPQASLRPDDEKLMPLILDERPPKEYWERVKAEFYLLICTDEPKYEEFRNQLSRMTKRSKLPVAFFAGAISSQTGVGATLIMGFCAVLLYGVVKVGKETYCSLNRPGERENE